jgi:hypothetical protein
MLATPVNLQQKLKWFAKQRFSTPMGNFQGAHGPQIAYTCSFQVLFIYYYTTNLCKQYDVIQNHENAILHKIGKDEAQHRKYKGLNLMAFSVRPFK